MTSNTPHVTESLSTVRTRYESVLARGLKLDMTRGKPAPEQLDLAAGLLETVTSADVKSADGTDARNYGGLEGLPEARALMGSILNAPAADVLIGGNASLQLMYDTMVRCHIFGAPGGDAGWGKADKIRFLCPVPGYDRHFAITEHLGYELVSVPMTGHGPDMDIVEALVATDPSVKGIWVVPSYNNPTGESVDTETATRLASMKTAAPDFRIFWDDAYAVHHLSADRDEVPSILTLCREAGNPDRVFVFGSTSKITHAGAGISAFAASQANIAWAKKAISKQTIGPDKIGQLRHVRFLRDAAGIEAHMAKHAAILKPKFDVVLEVLKAELDGTNLATWTSPKGGYFISLDTLPGFAKRVVALADEAGVKLTAAGATFPYGKDPSDSNIRLAPSYPGIEDLRLATEVVALCVKLAWLEKQ